MSRFNPSGSGSGSALWQSPISPQSNGARQAQQANEEAWRRAQQQQQMADEQQFGEPQPGEFEEGPEPVDYDIYHKAVAVSSPRLGGVSGDLDPQATIRKTVIRRVEVPFTRSVQVPSQMVKLVPTTVEQKVPVRKLVQVAGFQTVNESYIEYEDREAIREREVWVKKIVPEKYVERVPVQKVRQVQKPTSVIKEVDSWEVVQVPTTRRVVVPGFRVEEIPDSKVVEVEEEQTFALRPEPVGPNEIKSTRDLGRLANPHSHLPDAPYGSGAPANQGTPLGHSGYRPASTFGSSQGYNRPAAPQQPAQQNGGGLPSTLARAAAAAAAGSPFGGPAANPMEALRHLGLGIDETHTRHTDGSGVVVTRIDRGGVAARAGLQVSDIITAVQGRPVDSVAEYVQLLQRAPGAVTLNVNRDGRRNISLVFGK